MRLTKSICAFITASLISTFSFAATEVYSSSWGNNTEGASVVYTPDYSDSALLIIGEVTHSSVGEQRVYFALAHLDDSKICTYENEYADDETFIFSGQAVKMLRWCRKSSDGQYYYQYTPETNRGHSYVINLFKKATTPITIKVDGETVYFPVMGFTKVWNSAGGNAI